MDNFFRNLSVDGWREAQQDGHSGRGRFTSAARAALDELVTYNALVADRPRGGDGVTGRDGPLAGVPVVIKDCFVDGGRVPSLGSRVPARWMTGTATIITRLRAAGATIVAYANLHEWMIGTTARVSAYGPVVNPSDRSLIAGGSSGGSAVAVAAGVVPIAIGTDAGGSIRIPAACCGVVGVKPTWGLVPTHGFVDDGSPIDHIGPLARSVEDSLIALEVLADRRIGLPETTSLRVGIATQDLFADADEEVADVVLDAVGRSSSLVASIEDVELPGTADARRAIGTFILSDVAGLLQSDRDDWRDHLQPGSVAALEKGASFTEADRQRGERVRGRMLRSWEEAFDKVDVVISPTLPGRIAPVEAHTVQLRNGEVPVEHAYVAWNAPMNLGGVPCVSVPCGELPDGQSVNLSITAAPHRDGAALALGRLFASL